MNESAVPLDLKCDGGPGSQEQEVFVEWSQGSGYRGRWGVPGWCGWNTYRPVDSAAQYNSDTWGLSALGSVDSADTGDRGWLVVVGTVLQVLGVLADKGWADGAQVGPDWQDGIRVWRRWSGGLASTG